MIKYTIILALLLQISCIPKDHMKDSISVVSYNSAAVMNEESSQPMIVDLTKEPVEISESDMRNNTTYRFTPIAMPEKRFIAIANWIIMCNDHILIVDREVGKKVDIFDKLGRWITSIDKRGRGRGEYASFYGAVYDKTQNLIMVDAGTYIMYYDFDGNFVKQIKSSYGGWAYPYGDKILHDVGRGQMFDSEEMYNLSVSKADSVIYRGVPYCKMRQSQGISMSNRCFYDSSDGAVLYRPQYRDTIYQISSDSTYFAKYAVKQDKSLWKLHNKKLSKDIEEYIHDGYTDLLRPFYETADLLYFTRRRYIVGRGTIIESFFYNRDDSRCYELSKLLRLDPLFNSVVSGLYSNVIGINGDSFIVYIPKERLDELAKLINNNPEVQIVNSDFKRVVDDRAKYRGVICEITYSTK